MSPLFVATEGRERHAPTDRRAKLRQIVRLYERILDEPGAHTSRYFHDHCDMQYIAKYLLSILEEESLETHVDKYIQSATVDLWRAIRLLPYPEDGGAS